LQFNHHLIIHNLVGELDNHIINIVDFNLNFDLHRFNHHNWHIFNRHPHVHDNDFYNDHGILNHDIEHLDDKLHCDNDVYYRHFEFGDSDIHQCNCNIHHCHNNVGIRLDNQLHRNDIVQHDDGQPHNYHFDNDNFKLNDQFKQLNDLNHNHYVSDFNELGYHDHC
jgi:hypothetical protein